MSISTSGDHPAPPLPPQPDLFFQEINPSATQTIVFLHGLLSSHLEYALVTPHLADYHLLLIDSNGHSRSAEVRPYTAQAAADRVAALIGARARGGRAHVVGLSMGGFIALDLGRRHPERVLSAFVTGAAPLQGAYRWMASHPAVVGGSRVAMLRWTPARLYWALARWRGLRPHEALYAEMQANLGRWEVVRDVYTSLLLLGWDDLRAVTMRTVLVAAGLDDDVESTRKCGPLLCVGGVVWCWVVVVWLAVFVWVVLFL